MALRTEKVQVENWRYPRMVAIHRQWVGLEVGRKECHQCCICQQRIAAIRRSLRGNKYQWSWHNAKGKKWLVIARPRGKNPLDLLSRAIGLKIQPV